MTKIEIWIEFFFTNQEGTGAEIKFYSITAEYEPLKGSSYIPLPKPIAIRKAILNVKYNDDKCLEWALKSALCPAKTNANNKYSYTKYDSPSLECIVDFPTPVSPISKEEKYFNLETNVYG